MSWADGHGQTRIFCRFPNGSSVRHSPILKCRIGFLAAVTIQTVPEPGSFTMFGLDALAQVRGDAFVFLRGNPAISIKIMLPTHSIGG
jgi:hypothetical protein